MSLCPGDLMPHHLRVLHGQARVAMKITWSTSMETWKPPPASLHCLPFLLPIPAPPPPLSPSPPARIRKAAAARQPIFLPPLSDCGAVFTGHQGRRLVHDLAYAVRESDFHDAPELRPTITLITSLAVSCGQDRPFKSMMALYLLQVSSLAPMLDYTTEMDRYRSSIASFYKTNVNMNMNVTNFPQSAKLAARLAAAAPIFPPAARLGTMATAPWGCHDNMNMNMNVNMNHPAAMFWGRPKPVVQQATHHHTISTLCNAGVT
ncbi:CXXC-type zinc finger protein 5-like protein [Lates japonicus]|uniref:CXXC-type zinc finger protein 5-like protein n=1 Tax=Lates japonicus TaxID=270547 RepID=A0AAD3NHJ1_LATJO|nr:CXXC-type zinc finger protein 5-like protein [Lates japonicus]